MNVNIYLYIYLMIIFCVLEFNNIYHVYNHHRKMKNSHLFCVEAHCYAVFYHISSRAYFWDNMYMSCIWYDLDNWFDIQDNPCAITLLTKFRGFVQHCGVDHICILFDGVSWSWNICVGYGCFKCQIANDGLRTSPLIPFPVRGSWFFIARCCHVAISVIWDGCIVT